MQRWTAIFAVTLASLPVHAADPVARPSAADVEVVLLGTDGTPVRTTGAEVDSDDLRQARAAWVWSEASPPRRLAAANLVEDWNDLVQQGLGTSPGSLTVVLPTEDRTAGSVIAAPVAMWSEVPESWLPRFAVAEKGPVVLPREASEPWRVRHVAPTSGTWWTDVAPGRRTVRLHPKTTLDLVTSVAASSGEGVAGATITLLDDVSSTARPRVMAVQRAGAEGKLRVPALPVDRQATFLIGAAGFPARPFIGRVGDLPMRVRLHPGVELRGRFEDPDGQPLAGIRVQAEGWLAEDLPVRFDRRTQSADDGSWSLPGLAVRPFVLTAEGTGFTPRAERHNPSSAGVVDLGRMVLERGAQLAVLVVSRNGEPVAGAEVVVDRLPLPPVTTDNKGRARLAGLPDGRELDLRVTAEGHLPAQLSIAVPWPEEARLVLTRGFIVTGRFVDPAGLPVSGGQVKVAHESRFRFEDLAPGGGFELLLAPGLPWSLELSSPTTRKRRVELQPGLPGERHDLGDLSAPPGLVVFGTLVSAADGAPVAGARVWMPRPAASGVLVSWLYGDVAEAGSDALGRFEVGGLPPEPGLLRVDAAGFARAELAVQPEDGVGEVDLGVVELEQGATVVVRVEGLDAEEPPRRASPRARLDLRGDWRDLDMLTAPVVDGEAELPHVPAGKSYLTVMAGRDLLCEREVTVEPGESRLEVACDARRAQVAGQVVVGDRPAGAGLLVWSRTAGSGARTESVIQTRLTRGGLRQQSVAGGGRPEVLVEVDDEGRFRTERLTPGRWQVTWQPISGTATAPRPVEVPRGEVADLVVRLPGLGLAGVVVDDEGAPVERARVRELASGAFALSRADGTFQLDGLSPGEVRLQAQDANRYSDVMPVHLEDDRPPDPVRLVVSTEHQGRVPVLVWDLGSPAAGAFVFLQADGSADLHLVSTGGDGTAEVVVPAPHPSQVRVAVRHEGRWAFGEWTRWERAGDGIEIEIPPPGELLVASDGIRGTLSVHTGSGWDLGRLLSRLGAPPRLHPTVPLHLGGLPAGRYVLSLAGDKGTVLAAGSERTVIVTSGHLEEIAITQP